MPSPYTMRTGGTVSAAAPAAAPAAAGGSWWEDLLLGYTQPTHYESFFKPGMWGPGYGGTWGRAGFIAGNLALFGGGAYALWGASQIINPTATGSRITGVQALAVGAGVATSPFWVNPARQWFRTEILNKYGGGTWKGLWGYIKNWWKNAI
jgi:hypothetical protein